MTLFFVITIAGHIAAEIPVPYTEAECQSLVAHLTEHKYEITAGPSGWSGANIEFSCERRAR